MKFFIPLMALFLTFGAEAKTLKVMQYNVENFFDTKHDEGTDDYTYLPLATKNAMPNIHELCAKMGTEFYIKECLNLDWSDAIFTKKIINISKVIKAFDDTGKGPDLVALEEVENKNVLNKLATKGLDGLGYQYQALIEGDDTRGIDVGLLSKYPIISANRYPIFVNGQKLDTRGILEVSLNVDGNTVVVYVNHWPSQSNPTEHRIESAKVLAGLADKVKGDLVIAMGDFNTIATDAPAPFNYLPNFIDSEKEARKILTDLNPGTHFYRGEWASLDHIFIHKKSALKANYTKFQIINRPFMLKKDNRSGEMAPWRFDTKTGQGFADHLPMGLEFNY